jgi:hypothetical protein
MCTSTQRTEIRSLGPSKVTSSDPTPAITCLERSHSARQVAKASSTSASSTLSKSQSGSSPE